MLVRGAEENRLREEIWWSQTWIPTAGTGRTGKRQAGGCTQPARWCTAAGKGRQPNLRVGLSRAAGYAGRSAVPHATLTFEKDSEQL